MIGYVARDENRTLYLYSEKPDIVKNVYLGSDFIQIDDNSKFDDISFGDEPVKVEINVKRI